MDVTIPVEQFLQGTNSKMRNNEYMKFNNKQKGAISNMEEELIRDHDRSITKLTQILESVANNQKDISEDLKDLTKQVSVLAKVDESIKRIHERIDKEILEKMDGFTQALKDFSELKVEHKQMVKKLDILEQIVPPKSYIDSLDKRIKDIEDTRNKIVWAIVSAVGLAILGLVIK